MLQIHPNARTTPAIRAETARSVESSSIVAQRYGISVETARKMAQTRHRGLPRPLRPPTSIALEGI